MNNSEKISSDDHPVSLWGPGLGLEGPLADVGEGRGLGVAGVREDPWHSWV